MAENVLTFYSSPLGTRTESLLIEMSNEIPFLHCLQFGTFQYSFLSFAKSNIFSYMALDLKDKKK